MRLSYFERNVRSFHRKFHFTANKKPTVVSEAVRDGRIRILKEESEELVEALQSGDLAQIAAESVDLLYVTFGTLVTYGISALPVWKAIHRANMKKVRSPDNGKPLKPDSWVAADIWPILQHQENTFMGRLKKWLLVDIVQIIIGIALGLVFSTLFT